MATIPNEILFSHLFPCVKDGSRFNVLIACKKWNSMGKELFVPTIDDFKRVITCDDYDTLSLLDKVWKIASHPKVDAVSLIKPYSKCLNDLLRDLMNRGGETNLFCDSKQAKVYDISISNMTRVMRVIMDNIKQCSVITPEDLGCLNIVDAEKHERLFNGYFRCQLDLVDGTTQIYNNISDQVIYTLYSNPKVFELIPILLEQRISKQNILPGTKQHLEDSTICMGILNSIGIKFCNLGLIKIALDQDKSRISISDGRFMDLSIRQYLRNHENTIAVDVIWLSMQIFPSMIGRLENYYIMELKDGNVEKANSLELFYGMDRVVSEHLIYALTSTDHDLPSSSEFINIATNNEHCRAKIVTKYILDVIFVNGCNYTRAIDDGLMSALEGIPNFYEEMEENHIHFLLENLQTVQSHFIQFLKNHEKFKSKRPDLYKMFEKGEDEECIIIDTEEEIVVERKFKRLKRNEG